MVDETNPLDHQEIDWEKVWSDCISELDLDWMKPTTAIEVCDEVRFPLKRPSMTCPNHARSRRLSIIEALAEPEDSPAFKAAATFLANCPTCAFICQKVMENFNHAVLRHQRCDDEFYTQD